MRGYLGAVRERHGCCVRTSASACASSGSSRLARAAATAGWSRPLTTRPGCTTACWPATGTSGTRTCRPTRGKFTGRSIALRLDTRRSTTSRARVYWRSAPATRAATSPSTRPTGGSSRHLDTARADVPAEGDVRPPAGRDQLAGEAAGAAQRADARALHVRRRDRADALLPRPAGAGDAQSQRAAAGGQQPAAVLDSPRPDRRRRPDRAPGREDRALRRRHEHASSTRSCGRPGSR